MDNYQREIEQLLMTTAEQNASDLHIAPGRYPTLRVDGNLVQLASLPLITPERSQGLCFALMTREQQELFLKEKEIDFSFGFKDRARFRANVYLQRGYVTGAFRLISYQIRILEE